MANSKRWSLIGIGLALVVGGLMGNIFGLTKLDLSRYVVSSPAPGMIATAVGGGGENPTRLLLSSGLVSKTQVPVTPTVFLTPVGVTHFGIKTGEQPAYWKVWWDQSSQVEAVVCLQQHVSPGAAADEVLELRSRNSDPSLFDTATVTFTSSRSLPIAIPGAFGYLWSGRTNDGGVPVQLSMAGFSRGEIVSLVTMTAYGPNLDTAAFSSFVGNEHSAMADSTDSNAETDKYSLVILFGIIVAIFGATRRRHSKAEKVFPASPWQAPLPATGQSDYKGPIWSPPNQPEPLPPPGWYADPQSPPSSGRLHYWNGTRWTGQVSDRGEPWVDPV